MGYSQHDNFHLEDTKKYSESQRIMYATITTVINVMTENSEERKMVQK